MRPTLYKILAVDDVERNLILIKALLNSSEYNFEVSTSSDGVEAISAMKEDVPDLVLLDLMMPGLNGFEVCEWMKSEPATRDVPVIFLTAKGDNDTVLQGFKLGAVDYMRKPFHKDELLVRIANQIKLLEARRSLQESYKELDTLVRVLCHDLKNPISAGRELMECFYEVNPEMREDDQLAYVKEALDSSLDIIKNVSTLAQLDDCKLRIDMGIHSLSEMVQSALAIVNSSLLNKQIEVDLDVAADCYLEVDKTAFINSVLVNALTNAIKFSQPHDHIQISDFRDGDQVGFVIRDYGTGMPKEIVEQLMADKEIPSTKGTLGEAGVGYGLKLMKRFTDMFMGEIRITSSETNPGEGFIGTNIEFRFSDS